MSELVHKRENSRDKAYRILIWGYTNHVFVKAENGFNELSGRHGHKRKLNPPKEKFPTSSTSNKEIPPEIHKPEPEQTLQQSNEDPPSGVLEVKTISKPDPFDLALYGLLVTIVIAFIYYLQLSVMSNTLDVMKNDQRAWIKIEPYWKDVTRDKMAGILQKIDTVWVPVMVKNIGKIPAKSLYLIGTAELLNRTDSSDLGYHPGIKKVRTKVVFPNDEFEFEPTMFDSVADPKKGHILKEHTLSDEERYALSRGDKYIVFYAEATYVDSFGPHWIRYCGWITFSDEQKPYNTHTCAEYGDTGDGPPPEPFPIRN